MAQKAEKVILGNIYTVDKNQPRAEATYPVKLWITKHYTELLTPYI